MPKQTNGLDHHKWELIPKVTFLALIHHNVYNLTFSNICGIVIPVALKTLLFCSCHITEMQHSQTSCKKEQRARDPPEQETN
jgi:hypothetical protein